MSKTIGFAAMLVAAAGLATTATANDDTTFVRPVIDNTAGYDLPMNDEEIVPIEVDSGDLFAPAEGTEVIFSELISVPGAYKIRLNFSDVVLAGVPETGNAAYLLITGMQDGAVQFQNQIHVSQWQDTSAYFNGDSVLVEVVSPAGVGTSRIKVSGARVFMPDFSIESICGPIDDRVLSSDPRQGRLLPPGCTGWLIDDNENCLITAGHCVRSNMVYQTNVPLSTTSGQAVSPPPEDQYAFDTASLREQNGGTSPGNDWAYFGVFPNSNTGLSPVEANGNQVYTLVDSAPAADQSQTIRITGYGSVSSPVDRRWNLVQKTHTGPYWANTSNYTLRYRPDTTGGNSGSPVFWEDQGVAIGVHGYAGCNSSDPNSSNQGTAVDNPDWQGAMANPGGVCAGPPPPPERPLFVGANTAFGSIQTVGTLDLSNGEWGLAGNTGDTIGAMTYDSLNRRIIMVSATAPQKVMAMDEETLVISQLASFPSGTTIHGIAHDPNTDTFYAASQASNSRMFTANINTGSLSQFGTTPGIIGGLTFDADNNILYGVDDSSGGTKLVDINTNNASRTIVGNLGSGINDVDGIAWCPEDGIIYAINDSNETLMQINPATGVATSMFTADGASFGPGFGMACGVRGNECAADLSSPNDPGTPDGVLTGADFFEFLDLFQAGDLSVDFSSANNPGSPDGILTGADFFQFLDLFSAGCP